VCSSLVINTIDARLVQYMFNPYPRGVFGSYISMSESLQDTFWLYGGGGGGCLQITLKSTIDVLVLVCMVKMVRRYLKC